MVYSVSVQLPVAKSFQLLKVMWGWVPPQRKDLYKNLLEEFGIGST